MKEPRIKPFTAIIIFAVSAMMVQTVSAAIISGNLGTLAQFFSHYDLEDINGVNGTPPNTQTTDWVLYGAPGNSFTLGYTTKLSTGSFSPLSGATYNQPVNGVMKFKHGAGFGTDSAATAGGDYGFGADDDATATAVSFTHTMLGEDETLVIYLHGLNSAQDNYDFSASITGSPTTPYLLTDTALPTERVDGVGNRDGDYGILTLQITGAQMGDVLNFSFSSDYSNETSTPAGNWGVGISGASTTVTTAFTFIPEPASLVLLGLAMLVLAASRRRKG